MDSTHVAKIIFLVAIVCLSAYFLYTDERLVREKFVQPRPKSEKKSKKIKKEKYKDKKSSTKREKYKDVESNPEATPKIPKSPVEPPSLTPVATPAATPTLTTTPVMEPQTLTPVAELPIPTPMSTELQTPTPMSAPMSAPMLAELPTPNTLQNSSQNSSAKTQHLPYSAIDSESAKRNNYRLDQDVDVQNLQLTPQSAPDKPKCRQGEDGCLEKEWRRDKYKDLVLIPGLEWSVPVRRTPLCTVQRQTEPCPLTDQTSLIGTLLDDAMRTDIGSIMPAYSYETKAGKY